MSKTFHDVLPVIGLRGESLQKTGITTVSTEVESGISTPSSMSKDIEAYVLDLIEVLGDLGKLSDEDQDIKRLRILQSAVQVMLRCIGDDPGREGLLKTPERYAKALLSFTQGYHVTVDTVVNDAIFLEATNDLVIVKDIDVFSLCEHHLVPFMGKVHVGYIPNGRTLGLSKFARIVEVYARRLQIQERLTRQIAEAIRDVLEPQGVAVVIESSHLCMVMRGVQKTNSVTQTTCMLGSLKTNKVLRQEFIALLGGK